MMPSADKLRADSDATYHLPERWLRERLIAQMAQLRGGRLSLRDACGEVVLGQADAGDAEPIEVSIRVHDGGFYRAVAGNGSVGAGEAYMDGHWDCSDLVGLIRLLVRNRDEIGQLARTFNVLIDVLRQRERERERGQHQRSS